MDLRLLETSLERLIGKVEQVVLTQATSSSGVVDRRRKTGEELGPIVRELGVLARQVQAYEGNLATRQFVAQRELRGPQRYRLQSMKGEGKRIRALRNRVEGIRLRIGDAWDLAHGVRLKDLVDLAEGVGGQVDELAQLEKLMVEAGAGEDGQIRPPDHPSLGVADVLATLAWVVFAVLHRRLRDGRD